MTIAKEPRVPTVREALQAVLDSDFEQTEEVRHVSIRLLGTGEVMFKMHPREGGEAEGGIVRTGVTA